MEYARRSCHAVCGGHRQGTAGKAEPDRRPQKRHGEALVQCIVPGGAVELLSAMLSVEDFPKAPQTRLNPTGGRGAGQRQYGGAVGQTARGLHVSDSTLRIGWGIITGATQMTIQCTCSSLIGGW